MTQYQQERSNNQIVADQMLPIRRDDTNTTSHEMEIVQKINNVILGVSVVIVALIFLFAIGIFIRRKRSTRIMPTSSNWKILEDSSTDFKPSQKRHLPSYRFNNPSSTKFPDKSYLRNSKYFFGSGSYIDEIPYFDSYPESYPLTNYSQLSPKIADKPPSLGDIPKIRTDSDTWEKYLNMMSNPERLNEAVNYMRHSPQSNI